MIDVVVHVWLVLTISGLLLLTALVVAQALVGGLRRAIAAVPAVRLRLVPLAALAPSP